MDQILHIELKIVKGKNSYTFCMPYGAPLGEAYDAAHEVLQHLTEQANEAVAKSERKEGEEDGSK